MCLPNQQNKCFWKRALFTQAGSPGEKHTPLNSNTHLDVPPFGYCLAHELSTGAVVGVSDGTLVRGRTALATLWTWLSSAGFPCIKYIVGKESKSGSPTSSGARLSLPAHPMEMEAECCHPGVHTETGSKHPTSPSPCNLASTERMIAYRNSRTMTTFK